MSRDGTSPPEVDGSVGAQAQNRAKRSPANRTNRDASVGAIGSAVARGPGFYVGICRFPCASGPYKSMAIPVRNADVFGSLCKTPPQLIPYLRTGDSHRPARNSRTSEVTKEPFKCISQQSACMSLHTRKVLRNIRMCAKTCPTEASQACRCLHAFILMPACVGAPHALRPGIAQVSEQFVRVGYPIAQGHEASEEGEHKDAWGYEYLQLLACHTSWRYECVYGVFSDLLGMLADGPINLLGITSYTEGRTEHFLFSTKPQGRRSTTASCVPATRRR